MKTLLLFILLFSETMCTAKDTQVYICDSRTAKKYHLSPNCKGLSHCSHRIIKISLEEAKRRGKTLCGWEK